MTTKMIKYLVMSDDELKSKIGHTSVQRYRTNIMESLSLFWD